MSTLSSGSTEAPELDHFNSRRVFALQSERQGGRGGVESVEVVVCVCVCVGERGGALLELRNYGQAAWLCPGALGRHAGVVNFELWSSLQIVKLIVLSNCISVCTWSR